MTFAPLNLMMDRVCRHGADSDTALFTELLYAGEFVLKFTVAAFVSAIEDDRESHRYRLLHGIVRADGVGEWAGALDEALSGTATQQLSPALFEARKVFTERLGKGTWQHEAVCSLHEVLRSVYDGTQSIGDRVALRAWFQMFAELRNKTRGHGAITPAMCAKLAPKLNESVRLLCTHNPIFALPWAYLHRNLSGKYRVASSAMNQTYLINSSQQPLPMGRTTLMEYTYGQGDLGMSISSTRTSTYLTSSFRTAPFGTRPMNFTRSYLIAGAREMLGHTRLPPASGPQARLRARVSWTP